MGGPVNIPLHGVQLALASGVHLSLSTVQKVSYTMSAASTLSTT
jgi:hypothetical protein